MRKIILAVTATILSLSFAVAQRTVENTEVSEESSENAKTSSDRPLTLGVTAGVNLSTYSGDRDPSMGLGYQAGINCDIPIGEYFSIMPELIFAYKTIKTADIVIGDDESIRKEESTDKMFFMNVPVNFKGSMHLGIGRPFISVGPMLNVGLYGESEINGKKMLLFQADPNAEVVEFRQKPVYNNVDFSVNFKAGYDFDFGLTFTVAYQLGIANMYKLTDEAKGYYNELGMKTSQKSRTISISLGYSF